jgi:hypothetical protein
LLAGLIAEAHTAWIATNALESIYELRYDCRALQAVSEIYITVL